MASQFQATSEQCYSLVPKCMQWPFNQNMAHLTSQLLALHAENFARLDARRQLCRRTCDQPHIAYRSAPQHGVETASGDIDEAVIEFQRDFDFRILYELTT